MQTKEEIKEYKRRWYQKNKEKILEQCKQNYQKNKEQIKEYQKGYYKENKDKVGKRQKEYYQIPEVQTRIKKYRQKLEVKAKSREYSKRPKAKARKRELRQRSESKKKTKEYNKKYRQRPEVKREANFKDKIRRIQDKNFNIKKRLRNFLRGALQRFTKTGKIMSASKYGVNYKAIIEHLKPFPKDISLFHIDHIKPLRSFDLTNPEEIKMAFAPKNHQWLLASENLSKGGRITNFK